MTRKKTVNKLKKINNNDLRKKLPKDVLISIDKINKTFGNFQALKNISFDIKVGERIGIIGANGAGKTTITEILSGVTQPTNGNIIYNYDYENSPKEFIGMQFQDSSYPSGLTVKDIILFAKNVRKINMNNSDAEKLLKSFQMEDFYYRKVRSLSGGQRQKLNILLAIMHNPKFIILDEISTGLDVAAREEIIAFIDKVLKERNISSIVISHHMDEIASLCNKVIVLNKGKIDSIAKISDLEKKYGSLHEFLKTIIIDATKDGISQIIGKNKNKNKHKKIKGFKEKKVKNNESNI